MLIKKIIKKIEKDSNIIVNDEGDYYSIYVDNPCGEDFTIEINKTKNYDDIQQIINYCDDFDPEEHAAMWYRQNRGEPSSLRDLLDNADNIHESLRRLAYDLRGW